MSFDRTEYKKGWDKARRDYNNRLVRRWKSMKGCCQCGFKGHFAALVLDHIDPMQKHPGLNKQRKSYNPSWCKSKLREELSKVQVLCANCHQARTYDEEHHLIRK